jgi:hypothetical protein
VTQMRKRIIQNVRATYAQAKFAHIQPIIQQQIVQVDIEPTPIMMVRAGQVITSTHQRLIDMAKDSMKNDEYIGLPDLGTDNEDQESINGKPNFEVQDDGIINFMHNITSWLFQMRPSE